LGSRRSLPAQFLQIRLVDQIVMGGEQDGKPSRSSFKKAGML